MPAELAATGLLPSPPGVVMQIMRLVNDEDSTVTDLANVIEADPVLSARLLGTVNSGLYTLVREIHGIEEAAVLLGFRAIRTLAMGVSLSETVPKKLACPGFSLEMYWEHCLMTAVLAKRMAGEVKRTLAEDAFSVGLIGNIGRLAIARCIPDRYAPALEIMSWPDAATEVAALGYTSAQVSAALLAQWGLPASLCASVRFIGAPSRMGDDWDDNTKLTTMMVGASDQAVIHMLDAPNDEALETIAGQIAATLSLSMGAVNEILEDSATQISHVQHLIGNNLPEGLDASELLEKAQNLLEGAGV